MSRIVIVGGHGKIALLLAEILVARGDDVVSVIRNPEHVEELELLGAEPAVLDIESASVDELAALVSDADAVVFSAGAGAGSGVARKRTVDFAGSVKSAAAAEQAGVRRFVQVSAIGVDDAPDPDRDEVWAAYVVAKRDADQALRQTSLDWTIIRPGGLTDDEPTGRVALASKTSRGRVPRADVAAVLAKVLTVPGTAHLTLDLVAGDIPIAEAVSAAALR